MGRWGNALYESDKTQDYLGTILYRLEQELAYWLSPEQVANSGRWLAQVFAVIELILLLEEHDSGSFVYEEKAVRRWRDVFLGVWDGEWQDEDQSSYPSYAYSEPEYRQRHRSAIIKMFDRLESIAHYWANLTASRDASTLVALSNDYPLPYFSISRWTNQQNTIIVSAELFISDLIEYLVKEIIYFLSPEKRTEVIAFCDTEKVWVAADILALICRAYEQSPGVNDQAVRVWYDTAMQIEKQVLAENQAVWDETDPLYQNARRIFDRLDAVAKKYPPFMW